MNPVGEKGGGGIEERGVERKEEKNFLGGREEGTKIRLLYTD